MTTIINLFGAPGSGKSTHRAKLFAEMKIAGYNVEEVTEYAKDVVWEEHSSIFADQLYIVAKQNRRLVRLIDKVDFIITDSPLLLSIVYANDRIVYNPSLEKLTLDVFNSYNNINIFINRTHEYQQIGRNQTEHEAKQLSEKIKNMLMLYDVSWQEFGTNEFNFEKLKELNEDIFYLETVKSV